MGLMRQVVRGVAAAVFMLVSAARAAAQSANSLPAWLSPSGLWTLSVGANLDPSHLFWQGIDPIGAVRVLGDAIHYVHAKDTQMFPANLPRTGVLDTKPYTDERNRSWMFRTVGYGHSAEWWSEFISTLRMYGYDNVLSIEHEDSLMSPDEGLAKAAALLSQLVIREKPQAAWWV